MIYENNIPAKIRIAYSNDFEHLGHFTISTGRWEFDQDQHARKCTAEETLDIGKELIRLNRR